MKKLLYIIPTLLLLGGISCFAVNQKQEMKSRAIPQVQAKNSSITPSENYVLKTHSYAYLIRKLTDDGIVYIKNNGSESRIQNPNGDFFVVVESDPNMESEQKFELRFQTSTKSLLQATMYQLSIVRILKLPLIG